VQLQQEPVKRPSESTSVLLGSWQLISAVDRAVVRPAAIHEFSATCSRSESWILLRG